MADFTNRFRPTVAGTAKTLWLWGLAAGVALLAGCSGPADSTAPGDPATPATSPSADQAARKGWPSGHDSAQSLQQLSDEIKQKFADYKIVQEQIFPDGWIQLRYRPESVTVEVVGTDPEGKPKKAVVHVKYQKLSSMIHPTEQAATADSDLIPYPAAETREEMTGRNFSKPYPPIEAAITYELKPGEWVRTDFQTAAVGREGADWLDKLGVP